MPNQNLPSNAADLTLTQLAAQGCDFINSQVAAHVFANTAMKNIYQGEIEKGGRGVTQEYSSDTTGSSITVISREITTIDCSTEFTGFNW